MISFLTFFVPEFSKPLRSEGFLTIENVSSVKQLSDPKVAVYFCVCVCAFPETLRLIFNSVIVQQL